MQIKLYNNKWLDSKEVKIKNDDFAFSRNFIRENNISKDDQPLPIEPVIIATSAGMHADILDLKNIFF